METVKLSAHKRWPICKKIRRAIQRELEEAGKPATESAVDEWMRDHRADLWGELDELLCADLAQRSAPESTHSASYAQGLAVELAAPRS